MRHYSIRTEEAYLAWIKRFIYFHGKRHPAETAKKEVVDFLTDSAGLGRFAASTQQELCGQSRLNEYFPIGFCSINQEKHESHGFHATLSEA